MGLEEPSGGNDSTLLPILCVEDGLVILRFSEIFGLYEPLKKSDKRERKYPVPRGIYFLYLNVSSILLLINFMAVIY